MSDHEDGLLQRAFAELSLETGPLVRAPGVAATLDQARRRRIRQLAGMAVAAVLVLVVPLVVVAATGDRRAAPPVLNPSESATPSPDPSATPSPSATATPDATPTGTPGASGTPTGLRNSTIGDLDGKTVYLDWSWLNARDQCLSGPMTFGGFAPPGRPAVWIRTMASADVDRDGTDDMILVLECKIGWHGPTQAIVLSPQSNGTLRSLGLVEHSSANVQDGPSPEISDVGAATGGSDGRVTVSVTDTYSPTVRPGCRPPCRIGSSPGPARASSRPADRPRSSATTRSPTCRSPRRPRSSRAPRRT